MVPGGTSSKDLFGYNLMIDGAKMIPAGYMAKRVARCPDWLAAADVDDIYSVSSCISENFADYINFWEHNGYWLFDSPDVISTLAERNAIDLKGTELFHYEVYDQQFDGEARRWDSFTPEPSFAMIVEKPAASQLEGYDIVTFFAGTSPECSPLSCNGLANDIRTNRHCLLPSFADAKRLLQEGRFVKCEPGPYRIFAVYSLPWP